MTDEVDVKLLWHATTAEGADEVLTFGFDDGQQERVQGAKIPGVEALGIALHASPHAAARPARRGARRGAAAAGPNRARVTRKAD